MEEAAAYTRIARKIDEQDPHTAPRAKDGSIHEAFIKHLELGAVWGSCSSIFRAIRA